MFQNLFLKFAYVLRFHFIEYQGMLKPGAGLGFSRGGADFQKNFESLGRPKIDQTFF